MAVWVLQTGGGGLSDLSLDTPDPEKSKLSRDEYEIRDQAILLCFKVDTVDIEIWAQNFRP